MKLTIGELERLTGLSRTTLRYYDTEGLIDPERQENGYRTYSEENLLSLVQIRQLNALGVELSALPCLHNSLSCADITDVLVQEEQKIEAEIEALYQRLSRLRLHVDAYRACACADTIVTEDRMMGVYRLFFEEGPLDEQACRIFRRWMAKVPDTYSTIRIPAEALFLDDDAFCPVQLGIGLLSGAFNRLGETFEPPMQYTPPSKCIRGDIHIRQLDRIPKHILNPFQQYLESHQLIPIGDFYGWIIYSPIHQEKDSFHISLRLGIH